MEQNNTQGTYSNDGDYGNYSDSLKKESLSEKNKKSKLKIIIIALLIPIGAYLIWRYVINTAVQIAASYIISFYVLNKYPNEPYDTVNERYMEIIYNNISLFYIIAALLFILLFWIIQKKTHFTRTIDISTRRIDLKRGATAFFIGTFAGVFFNIGLSALSVYLPKSWVDANAESVQAFDGGSILLSLTATVICAPIVEELLFRGFLYNAIKKIIKTIPNSVTANTHRLSVAISTIVTSALFGIYHENILQAIYAGVLSLFMIWLYEVSGSLITNMLFHGAFNFSGLATGLMNQYMGVVLALVVSAVLTIILMIAEYQYCRVKSSDSFI